MQFPSPDLSWDAEWQEFRSAIVEGREPMASGADGLKTMQVIGALYESAQTHQTVSL